MSKATVRTGIDSWVASNRPNLNHGTDKGFTLQAIGPESVGFLYLKSPAPRGATITSARLKVYQAGAFTGSVSVTAMRVAAKWTESRITYNNRPGVAGAAVTLTKSGTSDGAEWSFDVSTIVQSWANGSPNYGIRLTTSSTTARKFWSLNAAKLRPVLEVTWSLPPSVPVDLIPSGGSAVSTAKPVLSFHYSDPDGGASSLAAVQAQLNPSNAFTSPAFDSGAVLTDVPELDLSATAYAGLGVGAVTYWRVRVQDDTGLWSPWSPAVSFTRTNKGALTLNSPSGDVVHDSTPDLLWTITGANQTARRIIITDDEDPTRPKLDTGRHATTETAFTVPAGIIRREDRTYRLVLHVWDDAPRIATAGDPTHLELSAAFTFSDTPGAVPITGLTAAQPDNGRPRVRLTWNRSEAPDAYSIVRDGEVIEHNLDPADALLSGTRYQYVDGGASPFETHTWKVRAKVNGQITKGASVSLRYTVDCAWIVDEPAGMLVPILFDESGDISFAEPEVSATYRPVNSDSAVRVVQALAGLEGTLAGRITDSYGSNAATWAGNLLWLKKRPERVVQLVVGALSLPVTIGNVLIAPTRAGDPALHPDDRAVSFDFWSQEGPTA